MDYEIPNVVKFDEWQHLTLVFNEITHDCTIYKTTDATYEIGKCAFYLDPSFPNFLYYFKNRELRAPTLNHANVQHKYFYIYDKLLTEQEQDTILQHIHQYQTVYAPSTTQLMTKVIDVCKRENDERPFVHQLDSSAAYASYNDIKVTDTLQANSLIVGSGNKGLLAQNSLSMQVTGDCEVLGNIGYIDRHFICRGVNLSVPFYAARFTNATKNALFGKNEEIIGDYLRRIIKYNTNQVIYMSGKGIMFAFLTGGNNVTTRKVLQYDINWIVQFEEALNSFTGLVATRTATYTNDATNYPNTRITLNSGANPNMYFTAHLSTYEGHTNGFFDIFIPDF